MDGRWVVRVVSTFWRLWIVLLWIGTHKYLFESLFSFHLGIYLGVELLAHMIVLCLTVWELRTRLSALDPSLDISEIGRSAKSYCEHTARTQPTLSDIVVTLVEMGEYVSSFHFFRAAELGTWEREASPGGSPVCWVSLNLLLSLLLCFQLDSYQKRVPLKPCKRPLNSFGGLCWSVLQLAAKSGV